MEVKQIRKAKNFSELRFKLGDRIKRLTQGDPEILRVTEGKIYEVKDIFQFYEKKKLGLPAADLVLIKDDSGRLVTYSAHRFKKATKRDLAKSS